MDWPLSTLRLLDQNFGLCISPEDTILPFFTNTTENYFRPWKLCYQSEKENESTIENTKDTFKINIDVQHFKPEEITVKVSNSEVVIEGKHEERKDSHGFISRQFVRRYGLPKECTSETVTSSLSSDGILSITANKIANTIKTNEKIVPITMCGPCKKEECKDINMTKKTEAMSCAKEAQKESMSASSKMESKGAAACMSELISSCTKMDVKEAASISESVSACSKMEAKDTACSMKAETEKKQGLLEDHCRLMKPELLKEAASGTEKILSESRKETDELLKLMSSSSDKMGGNLSVTTERVEEALQQCKTAMSELAEKVAESSMSSEMSSFKSSMMSESSTVSESFESKETMSISGKSSSLLSESLMMGADKFKLSELVSDVISAELREAAENM